MTERKQRPPLSTIFIIDECANLGKMDGLITAITLFRSYGIRLWCIFQDLGQLKALYPYHWSTIINNCDVIQAFGFRNYLMAKQRAEIIGNTTPTELLKMSPQNAYLIRPGRAAEIIRRLDYLNDKYFKNSGFEPNRFYEK